MCFCGCARLFCFVAGLLKVSGVFLDHYFTRFSVCSLHKGSPPKIKATDKSFTSYSPVTLNQSVNNAISKLIAPNNSDMRNEVATLGKCNSTSAMGACSPPFRNGNARLLRAHSNTAALSTTARNDHTATDDVNGDHLKSYRSVPGHIIPKKKRIGKTTYPVFAVNVKKVEPQSGPSNLSKKRGKHRQHATKLKSKHHEDPTSLLRAKVDKQPARHHLSAHSSKHRRRSESKLDGNKIRKRRHKEKEKAKISKGTSKHKSNRVHEGDTIDLSKVGSTLRGGSTMRDAHSKARHSRKKDGQTKRSTHKHKSDKIKRVDDKKLNAEKHKKKIHKEDKVRSVRC